MDILIIPTFHVLTNAITSHVLDFSSSLRTACFFVHGQAVEITQAGGSCLPGLQEEVNKDREIGLLLLLLSISSSVDGVYLVDLSLVLPLVIILILYRL